MSIDQDTLNCIKVGKFGGGLCVMWHSVVPRIWSQEAVHDLCGSSAGSYHYATTNKTRRNEHDATLIST